MKNQVSIVSTKYIYFYRFRVCLKCSYSPRCDSRMLRNPKKKSLPEFCSGYLQVGGFPRYIFPIESVHLDSKRCEIRADEQNSFWNLSQKFNVGNAVGAENIV